ncbi:phosphonate ABC transporter, permease protein PhnE [Telluria aromaticivorans]|uniref:Phosphonate ABC transporter, permease protein PhnE n=1 Tax=Telluria aromaticivorans TaxID=2725995 RepID=A0A7Y2NZT0_9BURK|nr:phosphonate ABC transporter, permease protein PhnE [Telluria aromaticivorans]NNG23443.1 phosphonate ABC transporter, permease protein PhnE [Telluria aromaticivorans]
MTPHSPSLPPPPPRSPGKILLLAALVALVVASFASLPLQWSAFFAPEALDSAAEFLDGFSPPDTAPAFLDKTFGALWETLAMSLMGTLLAVAGGLALALPASGRMGGALRGAVRALLNVLRSIPELVWASLLLVAAGLGPFAGTLALAAHTTGVLGRLFADALENVEPLPEQTLRTNGAAPLAAFLYATLPQALPQMLSYALYRWENNIRAAAVLGVVGAGGLGQMLKYHLSLFQMQSAATVVIAMLLLVALVDAASYALRRALTR